jgi:hypothetical protein
MMLYFLGIVTGGITSFVAEFKVSSSFVMEGEDETNNSRVGQNLIEEDVICHDNYFTISEFEMNNPLNSDFYSPRVMDVLLSMVVPPPERG